MIASDSSSVPEPAVGDATRFAVFGQPIAHSLSPRIHAAFARSTGRLVRYDAIEAGADAFIAALDAFAADGGRGANVTLPLKELARTRCARLSERAERAGSVNTLTRTASGWHGDNTDGSGFVRDVTERHRLDLRGRRTLLLGAGGAAHGVAFALIDAGVAELIVANRTPERADALVDAIGDPDMASSAYWDDLRDLGSFELIVNATSAGLAGERLDLPTTLLAPRALCYDLSYGKAALGFLAWARAGGAREVHDGLGMLVEQAADAFELWHGVRPDTAAVFAELRGYVPGNASD